MSKTLSVAEVAAHKDESSGMYIIIDETVYDVTSTYTVGSRQPSYSQYCTSTMTKLLTNLNHRIHR